MRGGLAVSLLWAAAASARPTESEHDVAFSAYLNALGMGVSSRAASTAFYSKVFGVKKALTMPVANTGQGGWTEDIITFPAAAHSSALVIMQWTDKRNHQNLPIKLQFDVKDPKAVQAQVANAGGKASDLQTAAMPQAIYAMDPDGYLLELVPGSSSTPQLKSIGVGVSNLNASAAWWASATGLPKGKLVVSKEWDTITFKPEKASAITFMDWHEDTKRPTKNMPIKLVLATSSIRDLAKSIQAQNPKGKQAGTMSMFQFEPLEYVL